MITRQINMYLTQCMNEDTLFQEEVTTLIISHTFCLSFVCIYFRFCFMNAYALITQCRRSSWRWLYDSSREGWSRSWRHRCHGTKKTNTFGFLLHNSTHAQSFISCMFAKVVGWGSLMRIKHIYVCTGGCMGLANAYSRAGCFVSFTHIQSFITHTRLRRWLDGARKCVF